MSQPPGPSIPFIKICGLRSYDEARLALDAGATAFGFLVGLNYATADQISPRSAAEIIAQLPTNAETVIVTHLTDRKRLPNLRATPARGRCRCTVICRRRAFDNWQPSRPTSVCGETRGHFTSLLASIPLE